jgi:hypothetical protein
MAFTIRFQSGSPTSFDDSHTLVLKNSGVIEVKKNGEQVALYSPSHWAQVKPGAPRKTAKRRVAQIIP